MSILPSHRIAIFSLLALSVLFLSPDSLPAQQEADASFHRMFTRLAIDSVVPVFKEAEQRGKDGYIFAFVDASSCFTCSFSLGGMARELHEAGLQTEIIAFMSGKSQAYTDMQKQRNGWGFEVVADPLYIYRDRFGVKALPYFYATDHTGRILLMDKCGGTHVEQKQIVDALVAARARHQAATASPLREMRRTSVLDSAGNPLLVSKRTFPLWSPTKTVLFDGGMKFVHVVDTAGRVVRSWDLRRYGLLTMSPLEPVWAYGDSVILGADVSLSPAGRRIMYLMNVNTGEVRDLRYDDTPLRNEYNVLTKLGFEPTTGRVIAGVRPRKNQKLTASSPMFLLLDSNAHEIRRVGAPDSIFLRYAMSDAIGLIHRVDRQGNIYECQSPSPLLNIYDRDGNFLRAIYPDYGPQRNNFREDMPATESQTMQYWVHVNAGASHSMAIFPSANGKEIGLVYMNTEYPQGAADPLTSEARLPMYLHRMTAEGARIGADDIPLPSNSRPFLVENGTVGLSEIRDDRVNLVWYRIADGSVP